MPKLLIVSTVASTLRGFLLPYARHFRHMGWQVDGAAQGAANDPECAAAFDSAFDVAWSRRPESPNNFFGALRHIQAIAANGSYDIVHVHTPVAAFLSRYALRKMRQTGKPQIIYTVHGFHFHPEGSKLSNLLYLRLEKLAGNWTDYLIVINETDRAAAQQYELVPAQRLRYMPGIGVDTSAYSVDSVTVEAVREVRQQIGLGDADRFFLMVAEFIPRKRHVDALQALALTRNERIHIGFAGAGKLEKDMTELARRLGIASRVHFLGFRKDIPALIRASTATLLPSEQEGLPRSIMESFSLGVPVVGTSIRGIKELLQSGSGLLVPLGDPEKLANAIEQLASRPELVEAMGENARRQIQAYDLREVLRLHEQLYAEALNCSGVRV
jgi:glycosyltransferase involved in cell wall biosynthesis